MSNDQCIACGQFLGKGHRCPTPEKQPAPPRPAPTHPSDVEKASPEEVIDRVTRARQAIAIHRRELAEAEAKAAALRAEAWRVQNEVDLWEAAASETVVLEETLDDGTVHRVFGSGVQEWRDGNGAYHNVTGGPAYVYSIGTGADRTAMTHYYKDGVKHREDGPADIYDSGNWHAETWYRDGEIHREDGPAEITPGGEVWFQHGLKHREGGPAVSYANGQREWWVNGKRHREDGPAWIGPDGESHWWIDGERVNEDGTPYGVELPEPQSGIAALLGRFR